MIQVVMALLILSLGCVMPSPVLGADDVTEALASITQQMRDLKSVQVEFVQEKKMSVFVSPITLRGSLYWERPDSFAWHIISPVEYAIIMRQGVARQWEGEHNTIQEFKTGSNPIMRVASQQLQRWFSGNYQQLAIEYNVSLVSHDPLVLACTPHKNSPEASFITRVSIQFRKDLRYIDKITIEEVSGDITNIQFENAHLNETIPADAWRAGPVRPHV